MDTHAAVSKLEKYCRAAGLPPDKVRSISAAFTLELRRAQTTKGEELTQSTVDDAIRGAVNTAVREHDAVEIGKLDARTPQPDPHTASGQELTNAHFARQKTLSETMKKLREPVLPIGTGEPLPDEPPGPPQPPPDDTTLRFLERKQQLEEGQKQLEQFGRDLAKLQSSMSEGDRSAEHDNE